MTAMVFNSLIHKRHYGCYAISHERQELDIMKNIIRQASKADAQTIAEIYNHYIVNSTATFEETPLSISDLEHRMAKVEQHTLPWLVSVSETGIVGYAYASQWNARSAYRFTAEVSVYVSPHQRSKGIGLSLYQTLFSQLEALSICQVIAIITLPNAQSIALHEKMGMTKVAHLERVGYKFDQWLDVGYWQGALNTQHGSI